MANGSVGATTLSRILVKTDNNSIVKMLTTQNGPTAWYLRKLGSLFEAFSLGAYNSNVQAVPSCVAATGTVTFSSIANNDTVTVNGRVYTAKTSGASGAQQFNIGGSDAAAALNFQAAVNADTNTAVKGVVSASSQSSAVSAITCVVPGNIGNQCTIAISAHGSVSAANLAGGSEGTTATWQHGL